MGILGNEVNLGLLSDREDGASLVAMLRSADWRGGIFCVMVSMQTPLIERRLGLRVDFLKRGCPGIENCPNR